MKCDVFRMILKNQLDEINLTTSPLMSATLPVDNLKHSRRSRVTRSVVQEGDVIEQRIFGRTINSPLVADGFSLYGHNLTGSDTYRIQLYDEYGRRVYDSSKQSAATLIPFGIYMFGVDPWGAAYAEDLDKISTVWFEPVAYRSFELTIKSYNNPKGFVQLGMIFLGKSVTLEHNFSWGNELNWNSGISHQRTEAGTLVSEKKRRYSYRELMLDLEHMTDADRNSIGAKLRDSMGKPVLVSAYPLQGSEIRSTEYSMIAKLEPDNVYSHTAYNQHSTQLKFLEI